MLQFSKTPNDVEKNIIWVAAEPTAEAADEAVTEPSSDSRPIKRMRPSTAG